MTGRRWTAGCVAAGVLLAAIAVIGAGRQLAYDEAVSFGYYVATPSPFDVFGRTSYLGVPLWTIATNNHPLFNFLEHLVWSATGVRAEWLYRVLPALCGGACVVVLGLLLRPTGALAAGGGTLFLATSPMFDDESHVMRGYTLELLLVLLAVLAVRRGWRWLLAPVVALGIVAHLYFLLALPGLAVLAWRWGTLRLAMPFAVAGTIAGLLGYVGLAADILHHSRDQGQIWRPDFPIQLVAALTGGPWLYVVAFTFPLAALGLLAARRERALWVLVAVYALVAAMVWAGARPAELYPRFFFFLLPGVAWLIASTLQRWPLLAVVLLLTAGASAWQQAPGWTQDQLATRSAAEVLAAKPGGCLIAHDEQVMAAYTRAFKVVGDPAGLAACPYVVAVTWNLLPPVAQAASAQFPERRMLPAAYPAVILSRT